MTPEPIQQTDLFALRILQEAALSPDGSRAVYTVSYTENTEKDPAKEPTWAEYKALHLCDFRDGSHRQLTPGSRQDHSPAWSPDGTQIAFLSDRGEQTQIYLLPVDGGEARQVTRFERGVAGKPVWSPDGREIAFSAGPQDKEPDEMKPYRVTRHIYRFDAMGKRLDRSLQDLYSVAVADGTVTRWTEDECNNGQPAWSADGQRLLYLTSFPPDSHHIRATLALAERGGDGTVTTRPILPDWGQMSAAAWSPDGRILFIGVAEGQPIGTQNDLWISDLAGEPVCLTPELDRQVGGGLQPDMPVAGLRTPQIWLDDGGDHAYVQVQSGGEVQIHRVSLHGPGQTTAVVCGEMAAFPQGLKGDRLIYAATTLLNPMDLFSLELPSGESVQITHLNRELLSQRSLPTVAHMPFTGVDGAAVEGWLLRPNQGLHGAGPHAGFLYIHGGPHSAFGHCFSFDFHLLAAAGYGVIIVNHRASTGYGDAFATAIKGDWGNLDYHDLMAGVDAAIERGWVDGERLALGGLSGGGNLTCWTIGQTDRFKAAIPENPVTNWVSFYGVSDIGPWFAVEELGGHPHEIPEIYAKCSPITYAHRCTTPTLLVQGEWDWRCPAEQSEQFYSVLKVNGCPVEMLRLPRSPHAGTIMGRTEVRAAHNEAMMAWLERWVSG